MNSTLPKILIIGATGQTGICVTEEALKRGFDTHVFVRSAEKLGELKNRVKITVGDATQYQDLNKAISDVDVVISVIGTTKNSLPGVQSKAITQIIKVMQTSNKRRLISLTGAGVRTHGDRPKFADKMIRGIMQLIAKGVLKDAEEHAQIIKKTNLDWTIIRAPMLTNETGKGSYNTGIVGGENMSTKISRQDLACCLLDIIKDYSTFQKMPMVSA